MSGNMIDYVKEFGENSFAEVPINDVDSLVLCQFCYLKFDGLVPDVRENRHSVTIQELAEHADYEKLFADERYERDNRALFEAMLESRRFGRLRLNCYINIIEKEWETQFSAVTFILEDGTLYVAFRGTDETIVGWKEDFNMGFLSPVPGQSYSVKYLNMVTGKLHRPFYIGGHSKGGNLAIYSAMRCPPRIQERIIKIYNMDGPGFRSEVLAACRYEEIGEKVVKILPQSSMVGMIFEQDIRYHVVESKTFGLAQHNPFTWKVKDGAFVQVNGIYESREVMNNALNEWILSLDEQRMKTFVDTLYQIISASKADNLIDFSADWKKSLNGMAAALREVDEQTGQMLKEIVRSLFTMIRLHMKEEVKSGWNRGVGKRKSRKKTASKGEDPSQSCGLGKDAPGAIADQGWEDFRE